MKSIRPKYKKTKLLQIVRSKQPYRYSNLCNGKRYFRVTRNIRTYGMAKQGRSWVALREKTGRSNRIFAQTLSLENELNLSACSAYRTFTWRRGLLDTFKVQPIMAKAAKQTAASLSRQRPSPKLVQSICGNQENAPTHTIKLVTYGKILGKMQLLVNKSMSKPRRIHKLAPFTFQQGCAPRSRTNLDVVFREKFQPITGQNDLNFVVIKWSSWTRSNICFQRNIDNVLRYPKLLSDQFVEGAQPVFGAQLRLARATDQLSVERLVHLAKAPLAKFQSRENRHDSTVEDLKNKVDQLTEQLAAVKTESRRHVRTSRCYKCGMSSHCRNQCRST
ncbi:hypothetical protein CLF_112657 [Clonorchis sinensis]|uniref:Uncharacterized protein n=1 Tax=Clonorchis sinensis TaxID=79923 RepID=G7YMM9_CLOSI|nr:hypothetical protein CLF_112657 [Clonorchis sinensis]